MNVLRTIGLGFGIYRGAMFLFDQYSNKIVYTALPIRKSDIKLFQETIDFRLLATNKSSLPMPIERIQGVFKQGNFDLGRINTTNIISLNPNSTKELKFQSKIISENVLFRISQILQGGNLLAPVQFTGKMTVKGKEILISRTFKFVK